MQQFPLAQHRARERRLQGSPRLEVGARADHHVGSGPGSAQRLVCQPAPAPFGRSVVRHDHHQIEIAVRAAFVPRNRSEQVDALRLVRSHEPPDDFPENRAVGARRLKPEPALCFPHTRLQRRIRANSLT